MFLSGVLVTLLGCGHQFHRLDQIEARYDKIVWIEGVTNDMNKGFEFGVRISLSDLLDSKASVHSSYVKRGSLMDSVSSLLPYNDRIKFLTRLR